MLVPLLKEQPALTPTTLLEMLQDKISRSVPQQSSKNNATAGSRMEATVCYRAEGHVDAQYNLGVMYENGEGVSQDYHQAKIWYEKDTVQNDAQTQFDTGVMYELGKGGNIDLKQARRWYKRSCLNGLNESHECVRYLLNK